MFDKLSIAILRIAASFVFLMLLVACIVEDYALNRDPTLTNCSLQAEVISGSVKNDKNRAVACGDECFQYLARCLPGGVQYARSSRYNPHASFLSVFLASQYPNGHAIVFSIIAFYAILAALGTDIENRQLKWLAYWPHAVGCTSCNIH